TAHDTAIRENGVGEGEVKPAHVDTTDSHARSIRAVQPGQPDLAREGDELVDAQLLGSAECGHIQGVPERVADGHPTLVVARRVAWRERRAVGLLDRDRRVLDEGPRARAFLQEIVQVKEWLQS